MLSGYGTEQDRAWEIELAARPAAAFVEGPPAARALHARLSRDGTVVLRSHAGRWIGTDIDAELQLQPDGRLQIADFGEAVRSFRGRWEVDVDGRLSATLEDPLPGWPVLILGADGGNLQARPVEGSGSYGKGGAFWPFRGPVTK